MGWGCLCISCERAFAGDERGRDTLTQGFGTLTQDILGLNLHVLLCRRRVPVRSQETGGEAGDQ